jgi:tetratricopeptide (TPR) repeat protein
VILDNADDARVLLRSPSTNTQADESGTGTSPTEARLDYIPRCHHGRVLVTSRSKDTAKELVYQKDVVAVEPMEKEQALALLCKKLDTWYTEQDAPRLARELDYMPLALTQAAAYICQREGRCSIEQYLGKIRECDISGSSVLDINARDLRRDREANNSIMLTWQISFNHIREVRSSASDLLSLMSFFDRQAIPEALLQAKGSGQAEGEEEGLMIDGKASERGGEDAGDGAPSERNTEARLDEAEEYEKDIVVLRSYGLVSCTTDRTTFEMHRLVQLATKKWLKAAKQFNHWSSQCIRNLEAAFPTSNFNNWTICQSLFPHAIAALRVEVTGRKTVLQQASLLLRSGQYASAVGAYADAEEMEERSLEGRRNVFGEGHPETLRSMNNLAGTYSRQGRYDEAEKVQVEVMEKRKEVLGEGHPDTLRSMNNLAGTYSKQGRLGEAEELQVEVLEKRKEVLGAGHPSTLTSMNNLAGTYSRQGRSGEAEKLQVEVMEKMKEVLGEGHPDTLTSMNNLAFTLRARGRRQSACYLISSCAEISQAKLGKNHPDTIAAFTNKAKWEADNNSDDTSDESSQGGAGGGGEEEEKVEEEHRGEGEGNDEGGGAPTVVVEDAYASRLDPRVSSNTWNEPQFLWLL